MANATAASEPLPDEVAELERRSRVITRLSYVPGLSLLYVRSWWRAAVYLAVAVLLVVDFIVGVSTGDPVGVVILLVAWWPMVLCARSAARVAFFRRHGARLVVARLAAGRAAAEADPPACPRCDAAAREPSGWCVGCTQVLELSPCDPNGPSARLIDAADREDREAAMRQLARRISLSSGGKTRTTHRVRYWRAAKAVGDLFPDTDGVIEFSASDPAETSIVWLRLSAAGATPDGNTVLRSRLVTRHTISDGTIHEIAEYPPLPYD